MRILLIGYYGKRNFGDDLFVRQLCNVLSAQKSIKAITVLCDEDYYESPSSKVSYLPMKRVNKFKRIQLIAQHDLLIWGGGTLAFTDPPTTILRMQAIAKFLGKSFVFLGVGLEGISDSCREQGIQAFKNAKSLYVRDRYSYEFASEILASDQKSISPSQLCLGGDLAFLDLSIYQGFTATQSQRDEGSAIRNVSMTGVFWWGESRAEFYAQQLLPLIEKYGTKIHLLPAQQYGDLNDNAFHRKMLNHLPSDSVTMYEWTQVEEYINVLSQMDLHLGNRLHSIIVADILGIPNIGIGPAQGKIANFLEKSQQIDRDRLYEFMQPIPLEKMEQVCWQYEPLHDFIQQESLTAQQGISTALGIDCQVISEELPRSTRPVTPKMIVGNPASIKP